MKDVDLEQLVIKNHLNIDIPYLDNELILTTIRRDLDFLTQMGLMDYSLLLGIEKVNETPEMKNSVL